MNNKGFTLTEILGVIVIISLLLILIVPGIINRINTSGDDAKDTENQIIFDATDQYINEHPSEYPPGKSGRYCITIQSLVDDGKLAAPVTDVTTGEDITHLSVMVTVYSTGNTDHELKEGAECDEISSLPMIDFIVEPSGSSWVKQRKVTIIYPNIEGNFEASHRIDGGTWTRDSTADNGGNIELTFTEIGKLEAQLKGDNIISSKINIINIDSEVPVIKDISTPSEWSNKNKTATATVYDGISGVKSYYLSKSNNTPAEDSSSWVDVNYSSGEKTINLTNLEEGTYYLWVKDKSGNISNSNDNNSFTIDNIDQTIPTCDITTNGNMGNNNWYKSNVELKLNHNDEGGSGITEYGITTSKTTSYNGKDTVTQTDDTEGIVYYGYVKDKAGNESKCTKTIKKDSTKPTLTYTLKLPNGSNYIQQTWSRSAITRTFSPKDNLSGVEKMQYRTNGSSTWYDEGNVDSWTSGEGINDAYFRVIDNAGNISDETHIILWVDWTPPTIPYCYNARVNYGMRLISTNCYGTGDCSSTFQAIGSIWNVDVDKHSTDNLSGVSVIEEYYRPSKHVGAPGVDFCNWVPADQCLERFNSGDLPVTFDKRFRAKDNAGNMSGEAKCTYYFRY